MNEIIEIEEIDEKVIREVVTRLVKEVDPLKIVLFGSYAYGKPNKGSDLDILVVVEKGQKIYENSVKAYRALKGILVPKDLVVATLEDIKNHRNIPDSFISKIYSRGRILYEKRGAGS